MIEEVANAIMLKLSYGPMMSLSGPYCTLSFSVGQGQGAGTGDRNKGRDGGSDRG
jgi:hypothetical protein